MATILHLPLEIVRLIIGFTLTPPFDPFRRVLNLRLVNRLFDQEVMYVIAELEVLRHESVRRRVIPWHHPNDNVAATMESGVLFLARYALDWPYAQSFCLDNFSAFLNCTINAIQGGLHKYVSWFAHQAPTPDDDDEYSRNRSRRLVMLTKLCRYWLNRPNQWLWKAENENVTFETIMSGDRLTFLLEKLYPKDDGTINPMSIKRVFLHSWALLSPPGDAGLSSTVIDSLSFRGNRNMLDAIRHFDCLESITTPLLFAGKFDLFHEAVQHSPKSSFDINDRIALYLDKAVCSGRLDMVRNIVLNPPRGPPHQLHGRLIEDAIIRSIRERHIHIAWYLLGLRGRPNMTNAGGTRNGLMHHGLRDACRAGYGNIVSHILETEQASQYYGLELNCCLTPLEISCGVGREDIVRLLLAAGANPQGFGDPLTHGVRCRDFQGHYVYSTGSMFAAAVGGHIGVANILVKETDLQLGEADWRLAARGAIECGQPAFLEWILSQNMAGSEEWIDERFDVLGEACVWGNADILRALDRQGFLKNRPVWAMGLREMRPSMWKEFGIDSDSETCSYSAPSTSYPNDRDRSLLRFGSHMPYIRFESPLIAAMCWSRADVVEFLVGLGWEPVEDILKTSVGPRWKRGGFPRRAVRRLVDAEVWAWEARDVLP